MVTAPIGYNAHAQEQIVSSSDGDDLPIIHDPNLKVELIVQGLDLPTTMAFLGPDDILVLEKDKGTVQRIVNGKMLPEPLLDVNVATSVERCMCGIALSSQSNTGLTYVFLYYTEAELTDSEDIIEGKAPLGNRLYRYELVNNKLINPVLLLDLPAIPGPRHNGGAIMIGPDNNLYVPIGDVDGSHTGGPGETKAQNYVNGVEPDGRSGILRITQDGQPVGIGILGNTHPLNLYYAYGIRNSFGFDFDPVTGNIWDTENGPGNSDEINLVEPGFNSGWQEAQGMALFENYFDANNLVQFEGKGRYSDPELVWIDTEGPTAAKFLVSDKLGTQYKNDLFVADVHNGRIYHFDLNEDRTDLVLEGPLADKIIDTPSIAEFSNIIFGEGFGGVTDLEVGPDGYLYVVSIGQGAIYRIVQMNNGPSTIATAEDQVPEVPEPPEDEDLKDEDLKDEDLEDEDLEDEDLEH
ncbi:MAG TPA: PQQ-dependent sugar dehydrogenase [Nitrososphaeraceae archaeon]|nr:PQQ-dependent sugar dehydrogenase [Nitrososphaeraceae archaeon]